MRAVIAKGAGGPDVLALCDLPVPVIRDGEVLVSVHAAGVNRPDVSQRRGIYPPPAGITDVLGLDIAGVITQVAGKCSSWKIGDRVCALVAGGGYADFCAVPYEQLLPIPAGLSWEQAAALPEVLFTAWNNLVLHGRIGKRERILIQGGASGVGLAAIQIAKQIFSCLVVATASSEEKRKTCLAHGADDVSNYRDPRWIGRASCRERVFVGV